MDKIPRLMMPISQMDAYQSSNYDEDSFSLDEKLYSKYSTLFSRPLLVISLDDPPPHNRRFDHCESLHRPLSRTS